MKILLVDDDQDDIEFFTSCLAEIRNDVNLLTANNGLEALNVLEQGIEPDHIFLDINMPLMNGLDCLKEIQNRYPAINSSLTILSSTQEYKKYLNEIKLSVHYYTKPDSFDKLTGIIRERISEAEPVQLT
jgi:two-component SAPR family response regulator